ncbi:hypothetical protein VCHENC02_5561B, partial [Vibrio harveyi]
EILRTGCVVKPNCDATKFCK